MRIPRSLQLWPDSASVHLYWRCHNKEFYLDNAITKNLFFKSLDDSLKFRDQGDHCKITAFCLMSNHVHIAASYSEGSNNLSKVMRYAHACFGARFNRLKQRSGKVAEGRPKTPRIQNEAHEMRVHFYIEANPIRAKFRTLENLKSYIYSSYGFYAYGIKTPFTMLLTPPSWYLRLGQTAKERQRKYRKLFANYVKQNSTDHSVVFKRILVGDEIWFEESREHLRSLALAKLSDVLHLANADPPMG